MRDYSAGWTCSLRGLAHDRNRRNGAVIGPCSAMPFLVTGSPVEAVRNTVFLGLVSGIYYWRARTEEAHLLAEDAKYREYHAWMARHGAITAPLGRFLTWAKPRKLQVQPAE